jgi:hypothetical protein
MIARHPIRFPAFFLAVATILAACSDGERNAALPSSLPIAETVNGERVPQVLLDALARERKLDLAIAEQRAAAISELTDYILLDQVSRAEDYAKDPQFAAQVELNRLQGNANATMSRFRSTTQVDDSVLQTEYRQQIAKAGRSEFDFSQLLFASEDDALKAAGEAMSQPLPRSSSVGASKPCRRAPTSGFVPSSCRRRLARPWLRSSPARRTRCRCIPVWLACPQCRRDFTVRAAHVRAAQGQHPRNRVEPVEPAAPEKAARQRNRGCRNACCSSRRGSGETRRCQAR